MLDWLKGRGTESVNTRSSSRSRRRRAKTQLTLEHLEERTLLSHAPGEHIHPILQIFIEGQQVAIPADIGLTATRHFNPHTHDTIGTLHVGEGPISGIDPPGSALRFTTLDDFFDVWRTTGTPGTTQNNPNAFFSSSQLMNRVEDATHVVRMTVNGVPNTEYENYSPHDADQVVLSFETITNNAPIANPQNVNVVLNTARNITLTGDDNEPEITQSLTFQVQTLPASGTLRDSGGNLVTTGTVLPSATLNYTPNAGFAGNDSFTFLVKDNGGGQDTSTAATVALAVATNLRPNANPQNVTVPQGTSKTITLSGDDGDPDVAQVITFQIQTLPANGMLKDSTGAAVVVGATLPSTNVSYTPNPGFVGNDKITFVVKDDGGTNNGGQDTSNPTDVSITVPPNHAPIATAQDITMPHETSRVIALVGADGDNELVQAISFRMKSLPTHGTLQDSNGAAVTVGAVLPSTNVTYTPDPGFSGNDTFKFDVKDDGGTTGGGVDTSTEATVSLRVTGTDDTADGSVKVQDGRLMIRGNAGDNVIMVDHDATGEHIEVTVDDNATQSFEMDAVHMIVIHTGRGNDVVEIDADLDDLPVPAKIWAGRGDDDVTAGPADSTVRGGRGDDTITGGTGDDELHGGRGADEIHAGEGDDKLWGDPRHRARPNRNAERNDGDRHADDAAETEGGPRHADEHDEAPPQDGDDVLDGGPGDDIIFGGYGHDHLMGDDGDDTMHGGRGEDDLDGGPGADMLRGGHGHDTDEDADPLDELHGMEL